MIAGSAATDPETVKGYLARSRRPAAASWSCSRAPATRPRPTCSGQPSGRRPAQRSPRMLSAEPSSISRGSAEKSCSLRAS